MNLWVRSQDKECLTNISNIQYVYKNNMHGLGTYYDNLKILGTYKTKERAIEVLDEIQNILKPKMIVNTYKVEQAKLCDGTQFIQPMLEDIQVQNTTTYVYEMPEK